MTAWDRRTESMTAKNRRRQVQVNLHRQQLEALYKEKDNAIEQYLVTQDRKVCIKGMIVAIAHLMFY